MEKFEPNLDRTPTQPGNFYTMFQETSSKWF